MDESGFECMKEMMEIRFEAHAKEHELINLALSKAEYVLSVRLEHMNEFRKQLEQQQGTFATKDSLIPLIRFQDRFYGIIIGVTILNILVSIILRKL